MTSSLTTSAKVDSDKIRDKRILIVDDDYYFRKVLEKSLIHHHHKPVCAESAKQAQQMIALDEFDLVISDVRMPEMTGIQLLQWIKSNRTLPVVLMTGFSEIIETLDAVQLGANGFLAKPFRTEDLLQTIADCFPKEKTKEQDENIDPEFCKIILDDFISGREMKFDIFIRITESKYVKIAHGGENIPLDRIQFYKNKNIHFLYMKKDDYKKHLGINLEVAEAVTRSKSIEYKKKVNFLLSTSEMLLQNLYLNEFNQEDFLQAKVLVENSVSLLTDSPDAVDFLSMLSSHTDFLYAHSVGVSLYATMIGKAMGWTSLSTKIKLSLGGLLHDIGKKEIPRAVLEKPSKDLTPQEVTLIESHPMRGAEILAQLQCVPTEVLQIVNEHHENCVGSGYPARLKKNKIYSLARVVAVANEFCHHVIQNPNSPGLNPSEGIQQMLSLNREYYDGDVLRALMKILKMDNL